MSLEMSDDTIVENVSIRSGSDSGVDLTQEIRKPPPPRVKSRAMGSLVFNEESEAFVSVLGKKFKAVEKVENTVERWWKKEEDGMGRFGKMKGEVLMPPRMVVPFVKTVEMVESTPPEDGGVNGQQRPSGQQLQMVLESLLTDEEVLGIGAVEPVSSNTGGSVGGGVGVVMGPVGSGGMPVHLYHPSGTSSGVNASSSGSGLKPDVVPTAPTPNVSSATKREPLSRRKDAVRFDVVRTCEEGVTVGRDRRTPGDDMTARDSHSIHPKTSIDEVIVPSQPPTRSIATPTSTTSNPPAAQLPRTGDQELVEEWRQQRLIATLTMRELRKIFPPLMQQYLHKKKDRTAANVNTGNEVSIFSGRWLRWQGVGRAMNTGNLGDGGEEDVATALYHHPLLTPEGNLLKNHPKRSLTSRPSLTTHLPDLQRLSRQPIPPQPLNPSPLPTLLRSQHPVATSRIPTTASLAHMRPPPNPPVRKEVGVKHGVGVDGKVLAMELWRYG
ncbi:hypothetical protein BC829DRAFT_389403 [Chytridium lagenaria]|nr:hypothetical protein BC829DRAFT_389403 [Chytridium lagenaria]